MTDWVIPHRWQNAERVYSRDMNDFVRDNLLHLREQVESASLISLTFPSIAATDRSPGWRTIAEFSLETYGKELFASLDFSVNNGQDTWPRGTIFVGEDDVTDQVEKVGERITRVAIRDGWYRSETYRALTRQRYNLNQRIRELRSALEGFREAQATVNSLPGVSGLSTPTQLLASGYAGAWADDLRLIISFHRGVDGVEDEIARLEREVQKIRAQEDADARIWRYRDILTPGQDRKVAVSSEIVNTRQARRRETIQYDRVYLRLLIDGTLSREFIHDGMDRTDTGVFYIVNVPEGRHFVQLQWRAPQFTGHSPESGTLISISNLTFQMKEVRYELLREAF